MDPAYPSMPPPGPDDGVRPMSYFAAAMWAIGAQLAYLWILWATAEMKESASYDLFGRIICQVLGFLFTLYLLLRVYAPEARIRDFVAARRTNFAFFPLALVIGLGATTPTYWLLGKLQSPGPTSDTAVTWVDAFYLQSFPEQIAVAVATIALGPLVEELLFRGALFRPLRQNYPPAPVILVTAILFAAVHLDTARMLPLFLMGSVLGYLRWASGSLLPPILLHMAFNAVPFFTLFRHSQPQPDSASVPTPPELMAGSLAAVAVGLALVALVAKRSRKASAARRDD